MPTALVTGANRGLGFEFTRQYLADAWHVIAACRNPEKSEALRKLAQQHSRLQTVAVDVTDHATIDDAARELQDQPVDVLINNAGVFGPNEPANNDWRQNFGHIDYDIWDEVIRINAMGPLKMAEAFISNIASGEEKKIITISSNLGSVGDTESGGFFAYRTSKAAVNMAMATLADELSPQGIVVALLDPGWCRTDMGGSGAHHDPADSVGRMRDLIAGFTLEDSGCFMHHSGKPMPW